MEINELAEFIKALTLHEVTELNALLPHHTIVALTASNVPVCPQGYTWSSTAGACVADVG